jgi:DNA-binding transcriptional regulator/RsmH inhibitor MraZ
MDPKGRVVIAARHRARLGEPFVMVRGPNRCLLAMSTKQWQRLARRNGRSRSFREFFLSSAVEVTADATTGRVQIPVELREWANLHPGTEVAVADVGDAVTIAPRSAWDERMRRLERSLMAALGMGQGPEDHHDLPEDDEAVVNGR